MSSSEFEDNKINEKKQTGIISMLRIFSSNRLENLVKALAEILSSQSDSSPFEPEYFVVQSLGMERWLSMELAKQYGVWANGLFLLPERMIWKMVNCLGQETNDTIFFGREVMTWSLMGLIRENLENKSFSVLADYLGSGREDSKLYQLSSQISAVFDGYIIFRPQLLKKWEQGQGGQENWQALLWQELVEKYGNKHRAAELEKFINSLKEADKSLFPARIS